MGFLCDSVQYLDKEKLLNYLSEYYSMLYRKDIIVQEKHYVRDEYKVGLEIFFYDKVLDNKVKKVLSDNDIETALREYAYRLDLDLVKFQYMGYVRHVGYFTEEESAIFNGVKLYLNKKSKTRTRTLD